tara:strand:+ start:106 stop:834 length:729 start_codon:yes stop_codon:yes gene_type:complete
VRVLVIGDSCTDVFIYGNIERICPEAPVPVLNPTRKVENGGMAKNVKSNLEALGLEVDIITNKNDIKKVRYIDEKSNQMVLRVDEHDYCQPVDLNLLDFEDDKYQAIIISDYCKGFLSEENIKHICNYDNVFIDTKKNIDNWILSADFIKINELEYKRNKKKLSSDEFKEKLIVTLGSDGCRYNNQRFKVDKVSVSDVSGAGDTFMAGLVAEYVKSKNIYKSIDFAQQCSIKVVSQLGVATV